jgi:hypothetical protein
VNVTNEAVLVVVVAFVEVVAAFKKDVLVLDAATAAFEEVVVGGN